MTGNKANQETRRAGLAVEAVHPDTGQPLILYTSHSRLMWLKKAGNTVPIYQAAFLVPQVAKRPKSLYVGLLNENDESQKGLTKNERGVGWICYGGLPDKDYDQSGQEVGISPGEVFLVFVNDKHIIYNWRWEAQDPENPGDPFVQDDSGRRFKERKF